MDNPEYVTQSKEGDCVTITTEYGRDTTLCGVFTIYKDNNTYVLNTKKGPVRFSISNTWGLYVNRD